MFLKKCNKSIFVKLLSRLKGYFKISFWINNLSFVIALLLFVSVHIALITYVLIIRADSSTAVKFARVPGMLLNLNCTLIYLLVLKWLVTWIRNSHFGRKIAVLDEFLKFHKMLGFFIAFLSAVHSLGHFFNFYYLSSNFSASNNATYAELLFTSKSGVGWVYGSASPTGWLLLLTLATMILFALPCIRRNGYFQIFFYTHWLYVVFFILLIIHAPNYWCWIIGPFFLTLFDRIYTALRVNSNKYGQFYIKDLNLLPSKVTNLVITRPYDFNFLAGDYIFINFPRIAKEEWHPFTISSAPEQDGELTVHIRSLGQWTNKIYEYFDNLKPNPNIFDHDVILLDDKFKIECCVAVDNSSTKNVTLNSTKKLKSLDIKVSINGPFGTSSGRILDAEHAVLISAGIGVTPFASILQSLWYKYSRSLKKCSKCSHEWYDKLDLKKFSKVDFIWTNRDFGAFEWFLQLLGEIELQQLNSGERFIDIHLFMTSIKNIQLIKKNEKIANSSAKNEDTFSLKLNPGRPDLDKLFKKIATEKKGKVQVFFCGPPELGKLVEEKAAIFEFQFSKEYF